MKKQTNKLFDLIKNLTKNEKRFFKLYSNFYNQDKDKNYLILFDILEGLKSYDEKIILAHISKQIHSKNISQIKTYLKKHIFLSLKLFHRNNSNKIQHYDDLGLVNLLMERGELVEAEKLLKKMLKKSTAQKDIQGLSEIKFTLWQLALRKEYLNEPHSIKEYYTQELDIVQNLENTLYSYYIKVKVKALFSEIRLFTQTSNYLDFSYEENLIQLLEKKVLLVDFEQLPDVKSKITYLHTLFMAYSYLVKPNELLFYSEKIFDLIEKNLESFIPYERCIALSCLMHAYAVNKNKEKLLETIKKLDDILKQYSDIEFLETKITSWCIYYYSYPQKSLSTSFLQLIDIFLNKNFEKMSAAVSICLCTHIARLYFYRKDYQVAQKILDKSLLKHKIPAKDINFLPLYLLNILCYLEQNHSSLAHRELNNVKRKLKREEIDNSIIMNLLKQIAITIQKYDKPFKTTPYKQIIQIFEANKERKLFHFHLQFLNVWAIDKLESHK